MSKPKNRQMRAYYRNRGKGVCVACPNPARPGKCMCEACADQSRTTSLDRYYAKKAG